MSSADQNRYLMSSEELMRELERLGEELEDLEQERQYLLRRTSAHISESTIKARETVIENLQREIDAVRGMLKERGFGDNLFAPKARKKP